MCVYDCIIVGGGIAGLQAAIQLGRYQHKVLVIDGEMGRSTLCRSYHNILGYPNGVSGSELRAIGKKQAEDLGILFEKAMVIKAEKQNGKFTVETDANKRYMAKRLLLATGIVDTIPPFANLFPCLGISVYVCPDCDGYEVKGKKTVVIGSGNVGANMALTLTYWTRELLYINHGGEKVDASLLNRLKEQNIPYINKRIAEVEAQDSQLTGYILEDAIKIETNKSFLAFGGNKVKSALASQLGVKIMENRHIETNSRTKETNIQHVFAAGDVAVHSEQVTIAMGEGSQAAIWIHKSLLEER